VIVLKNNSPHKRLSNASERAYIFTAWHRSTTHCCALISLYFCAFSAFVMCASAFFLSLCPPTEFASWIMANKKILLWENVVQNSRSPPCVQKIKIKSSTSVCTRARLLLYSKAGPERAPRWLPAGPDQFLLDVHARCRCDCYQRRVPQ